MLKDLPASVQAQAFARENIFRVSPFLKTLRTHKLNGYLKDCYAFSVNHKIRIIFKFIGKNTVQFLRIGDHDVYQKRL
jgi:mRNA-degrading endonuclease YafQ of YafQ-DinJ toxin-antitoxin module